MILFSAQRAQNQATLLACARLEGASDDIRPKKKNEPAPRANATERAAFRPALPDGKQSPSRTANAQATAAAKPDKFLEPEMIASPPKSCMRSATSPRTTTTKRVGFGFIHVREHALTVGDHDWCDGSLPITLDWRHAATKTIRVDDFEWIRERRGRTPRGRLVKLDLAQRKKLLRHVSGIPAETIAEMLCQPNSDSRQKQTHPKTVTKYPR